MIKRIYSKHFKAYENLNLEFKPITVLLGPNNSGKSSILSLIRILSQTVKSNDPSVSLLLNGEFGDFGTYKDIVYNNQTKRHITIEVEIDDGVDEDSSSKRDIRKIKLIFRYRPLLKEIILKSLELYKNNVLLIKSKVSEDTERQVIERISGYSIPYSYRSSMSKRLRLNHFLPNFLYVPFRRDLENEFNNKKFLERNVRKISITSREMHYSLSNIDYIGAMRVPPARTYLFSGERRRSIGASGENCASILAMDSLRKGRRTKNIMKSLINWLDSAGIVSDIKIIDLSERHYEIRLQHPVTKEYQNFADVGYGNSQIIPVLVGGFNLNEGSTYIVEEPEIHLHPRAQSELGNFFHQLYKRGVNSIIETHSEYMVLRLQQLVAKGLLSSEDISFYYIYASEGEKRISNLVLDQKGKFINEWPEGFFAERLEEARKLAIARVEKN